VDMNNRIHPPQELDVRVWVPIERHRNLLKLFKELPVGESFIFINDHDPLPLYYEFRSIHGDVVGWEYLQRGGQDWKVMVTRLEASVGREFTDISTLMDLRKVADEDWKHVVFHRYGMMEEGHVMELIAAQEPKHVRMLFEERFAGKHSWTYKKQEPGEWVAHIRKQGKQTAPAAGAVVSTFDVRPFHPAKRHEMVFDSFDALKPGEAFIFTNDHDPKPLYYQIEAESKIPFTWEYLQAGPEVWEVRVTKTN
ncbi:MAG TPA: DUF2249 domain-containing protein, partial [Flavobacteriales bacterium]|nr:DUF2249 domain-containing protein [Flavobacteriales bacterium]